MASSVIAAAYVWAPSPSRQRRGTRVDSGGLQPRGEVAERELRLGDRATPSVTTSTVRPVAAVELSQHVQEAVAAEREVVAIRLEQLRAQAARLHEIVDQLDERIESDARLLRQIEEMLGVAPQLSLEGLHGELRGQRLRDIAVALLREKKSIGSEVHYRDWYAIVVDAGGRVAGKDPIATFLTQIARAPEVESVRPRSGLYRLRSA